NSTHAFRGSASSSTVTVAPRICSSSATTRCAASPTSALFSRSCCFAARRAASGASTARSCSAARATSRTRGTVLRPPLSFRAISPLPRKVSHESLRGGAVAGQGRGGTCPATGPEGSGTSDDLGVRLEAVHEAGPDRPQNTVCLRGDLTPDADTEPRHRHDVTSVERILVRLATTTDRDPRDRKSTRLNSSHVKISYAVFCL